MSVAGAESSMFETIRDGCSEAESEDDQARVPGEGKDQSSSCCKKTKICEIIIFDHFHFLQANV